MSKYIFIAPDLIKPIDDETLSQAVFQVEFNGHYLLQIENKAGNYKITNAMNGWGNNCLDDFNRPVTILHSLTTPSPDVAGSDAVGFAEWIGANYVTNGPGIWSRERDMQRVVTPKYSSSQLYAKFREEHHQPAGASVDYSIRSMAPVGFGDLFEALYNFFHCETDGKGIAWEALQKEYKKCEQDGRVPAFQAAQSQPAPGIPDVRELVEIVEAVAHLTNQPGYVVLRDKLRQRAQTALAGIKQHK